MTAVTRRQIAGACPECPELDRFGWCEDCDCNCCDACGYMDVDS